MFTHSHEFKFVLTLLSRAHNPEVTGSKPVAAIEASLFLYFFVKTTTNVLLVFILLWFDNGATYLYLVSNIDNR